MNTQAVSRKLLQLAAIGALGAGLLLQPSPSFAQGAAPQATPSSTASPPAASPSVTPAKAHRRGPQSDADIEAHLKRLHAQLKITPAEEDQWSAMAQIIRDNEHQISSLLEARRVNAKSMTALDNLRGYQQLMQAHADGVAKLLPAFEQLYNQMPDAQKKVADNVFNQRGRTRTAHAPHQTAPKSSNG